MRERFGHGHGAIAIIIMLLEAVDHTLAHGLQPERFVFGNGECAVAICVMLGQLRGAGGEGLLFGQAAIFVGVVLLQNGLKTTTATTTFAALTAMVVDAFQSVFFSHWCIRALRHQGGGQGGCGGGNQGDWKKSFHG